MQPARQFFSGMIDYAGLFPPASLGMREAVEAYVAHRSGPDSDLLGRFIVPVGRIDELADALAIAGGGAEWRVSVIAGESFAASRDAVLRFNGASAGATCDAIEAVATSPDKAKEIVASSSRDLELFVEIPTAADPLPVIEAIAGTSAFAKIRTGGVVAEAIPSPQQVLRFMVLCRTHGVPFKATAGLHHLIRSEYPLTYEPTAAVGTMFGFLNIFLASAALQDGWDHAAVLAILEERDVSRVDFQADGAIVHGRALSMDSMRQSRTQMARSFGSCSFTEPVSEARALGII